MKSFYIYILNEYIYVYYLNYNCKIEIYFLF